MLHFNCTIDSRYLILSRYRHLRLAYHSYPRLARHVIAFYLLRVLGLQWFLPNIVVTTWGAVLVSQRG